MSLVPRSLFHRSWLKQLICEFHVSCSLAERNQFGIKLIDHELNKILFGNQRETHLPLTRVLPLMKDIESFVGTRKLAEKIAPESESHKREDLKNQLIARHFPKLQGGDLNEHFKNIAAEQVQNYKLLLNRLADATLPPCPSKWIFATGWTAYSPDGTTTKVDYPSDNVLVFDVEVCVPVGQHPILAVAVSDIRWYAQGSICRFYFISTEVERKL
ncbi:unnamed protein product [Soboliphyme baturini]|uniref:DNA-directed DNA polymerase n=1 Tax=Soboliphyme baturini TaxID=241478 RepID=A0A183IA87_9BILA|nr:unnamed protein product [Soboliphyme baturini]